VARQAKQGRRGCVVVVVVLKIVNVHGQVDNVVITTTRSIAGTRMVVVAVSVLTHDGDDTAVVLDCLLACL
jgi:hypothetical protein